MEMTSLNISLPKPLKEYVEGQVAAGAYSTPSEYVRDLVREERKRRTQGNVEVAHVEGINSGPPAEIRRDYWAR